MSKFNPDTVFLASRLADAFGEACAEAAEADKAKAEAKARLLSAVAERSAESALFQGESYDVTVSTTVATRVDWEAVARKLAAKLELDEVGLARFVRHASAETRTTRVCAKARIERAVA
jgi:hypothetical protein